MKLLSVWGGKKSGEGQGTNGSVIHFFSIGKAIFHFNWPSQRISNYKLYKHYNMSKVIFPNSSASLQLKVEGVFATPDEWKTTDDANPSLFAYTARFFQFQIEKGKIFPRELTAKELREQEEKNKKGGKKETKKEQGNAEEERLRKLQQQQERKRQEEWSKLPAEDRNYRQYEDAFRSPQLRFENNTKKVKLQGKEYTVFEERVGSDQGEWIYLYKAPSVSEDELAKMRKTKPKTLANINDLNPIIMRAWVDLSAFNSKDNKKLTQRCKLFQVDKTAETPQPNLENAYIKISLVLDSPFLREQDGIAGEQLISDPPSGQILSDRIKVVNELRDELRLAISSLSMQYSSMFWKQLNIYEDFKNINYFINKKNEITKRKEQFLYDFNVSGKYKILKDRIKKVIVHLCESFFTEQMGNSKSFTGISCSIKDQFYSEIYNFLVTKYRQILQELVFEKKENLKEVEVLSASAQKKNIDKMLNSYQQQSIEQRITRIVDEYELLGNYQYGEGIFKKYMEIEPNNVALKYSYSMYCLRNKLKRAEEILPFIEQYLSYNKDDQKVRLQYLLLLIASQNEENCKKAWVLLRQILALDPYNTNNLMLASFLFKDFLQQEEIGNNFSVRAERSALRSSNKIGEIGRHKQKSIPSQLPTLKALPSFSQSLPSQQKDQVWIQLLNLFLRLNLFSVIEKITPKIKDTSNEIFDILALKNLLSLSQHEEFQAKAREVYEKSRSVEVLDLLVSHFLATKHTQTEKYLKVLLTRSKGDKQTLTLLKMAHYYLESKQIGNSRACVLKYLQKRPTNSGFSWRMLGICQLGLNNLQTSLQCLRKANILDIDNADNWVWLAKVYALQGRYSMTNQCLNQYELMTGRQSRSPLYDDLCSILSSSQGHSPCEQKLRLQLSLRLS